MKIGVIISTYNNPKWLEKTLWGYCVQTRPADEIIIADDGSKEETRALIDSFRCLLPIKHIWHEDKGFCKNIILNKATIAAESEYLIFTDQDCIPRDDFIETHELYAEEGYFLSSGYFKMPLELSKSITKDDILSRKIFTLEWVLKNKLPNKLRFIKIRFSPKSVLNKIFNATTTHNPTWNGCSSSGWREDIIRINGYDNDIHYGGGDRELGQRLINSGIKPKQVCYSAVVFHLDHGRPYVIKEQLQNNKKHRLEVKRLGIVETTNGIKELEKVTANIS